MSLRQPDNVTATDGLPSPLLASRQTSDEAGAQRMVRILLALSLAFGSISVLCTLFALYWFVKMRRSFRHELILLLVHSDFIKSMAFVVFPIVSLTWGSIQSDSVFCQLSGFTLAVGIESADIAVLLIALHSAMYILRPRSGLYPYRRFAYAVFYVYPVTAACLAFVGGDSYENMGHFCYLRTDRSWARLALSWIPRYMICVSIVVIYASIYLYVRKRMGDYGRRRSEAARLMRLSIPSPLRAWDGLSPSASSSRRGSAADSAFAAKDRLRRGSSPTSTRDRSSNTREHTLRQGGAIPWKWATFPRPQSSGRSKRASSIDDARDSISLSSSSAGLLSPPPPPPPAQAHTARRNTLDAPPSPLFRNAILSQQPHYRHIPAPKPSPRLQLSALFVYPLAYIIVWLFPFVSHVLGYDDDSAARLGDHRSRLANYNVHSGTSTGIHDSIPVPDDGGASAASAASPHWLLVVSIISLSVQGAVDCALFLAREEPWRHSGGRGFLAALGKRWAWRWGWCWRWLGRRWSDCCGGRCGFCCCGGGGRRKGNGCLEAVGRTREEMLVDGRLARERRMGEMAAEREEQILRSRRGSSGDVGGRDGVREWWERWEVNVGGDEDDVFSDDDDDADEQRLVEVRQGFG